MILLLKYSPIATTSHGIGIENTDVAQSNMLHSDFNNTSFLAALEQNQSLLDRIATDESLIAGIAEYMLVEGQVKLENMTDHGVAGPSTHWFIIKHRPVIG